METPLLAVDNLRTWFRTPGGVSKAVDGVSFTVEAGRTRALVGESGSGKSITALSVLQLVPEPAGFVAGGRILLSGEDLLERTWTEMRSLRGKSIAMIFQEPMTSLNPVFPIGWQLAEAMAVHGVDKPAARKRSLELLERVGLRDPKTALGQFPHELSGGMRQRVMIAIALANRPQLLVADEPTTALDATVQQQILDLIDDLRRETGMGVLLITHDLGVVRRVADHVSVMVSGQVVEDSPADVLFENPRHPYTRALLASLPGRHRRGHDLVALDGAVPSPVAWPQGCRFAPRCPERHAACDTAPPVRSTQAGRQIRCHLPVAEDIAP